LPGIKVAGKGRRLSLRSSDAWTVAALHANAPSFFRVKNSNWLTKAFAETLQNGQNTEVKRLGKRLGRISVEEMDQVIEGLNEIIGT
jgi:hypothetical protein